MNVDTCINELRTETDDWIADDIMYHTGGGGYHEDDITEAATAFVVPSLRSAR